MSLQVKFYTSKDENSHLQYGVVGNTRWSGAGFPFVS